MSRTTPCLQNRRATLAACFSAAWFVAFWLSVGPASGEEFQPLFNGKDLTGWTPVDGPASSWKVDDGVLVTTGEGGGWLSTDKEYGDYELRLEFKVPAGGNSGVFIRAPREGQPWIQGMEIQLLDDAADQYKDLKPFQYTGSVYGIEAAKRGHTRPAGEWQAMTIRCQGPQVTISLNGTVITQADLSKHKDKAQTNPGITRERGYIGLQNHGSRLDFRKIEIRELK